MSPPDHAAPAGNAPDAEAASGLAGLLAARWKAYRQALRRCRRRPDEEAVHDLRVETRRLLAVLQLAKAAAPDAKVKKLRRHLRRRLKALSRLRDLHVQLGLLAPATRRTPGLHPLRAALEAEAARLADRQARSFRSLRPGRERRRLARVLRAVAARTATPRRDRAAAAALRAALARAAARAESRRAAVDAARPETLHRLRVALKRQRYMAEALAGLGLAADAGRPAALREAQRRLGRIQDLDVLVRRIEKFTGEAPDAAPFAALAGRLRRQRDRLVLEFLASPGPAETPSRAAQAAAGEAD